MTQIHRFSERVIDLAERLEDMTDAANGKGRRGAKASTRFIILPQPGLRCTPSPRASLPREGPRTS